MAENVRAGHLRAAGPVLVLLDARNRTRQAIEQTEGDNAPFLDGWAVLTYQQVLSSKPFAGDILAGWLLNR